MTPTRPTFRAARNSPVPPERAPYWPRTGYAVWILVAVALVQFWPTNINP